MTRDLAVLLVVLLAVVVVGAMLFAWRRRLRRDSDLTAPLGVPEHAEVTERAEVLYVATTRHDQPLERVALKPLEYRARGELVLTDRGVALSLDGAPTVFLASSLIVTADLATVAIDRVVEPNGLIRVVWRESTGTLLDSFLRVANSGPQHVLAELQRLCAAPETGASA
ncbi:hypothetical protein L2X99_05315 [Microbacterium sp. KUDC0406]|uniref:PH-like domain-containing protein n=1 Tax=Microbacterium sp. KUDC0406 TaxID=2909588 RepID=UPI001F46AFAE|nr:hypothetical protein [Microbacterium sp. KUDC0406]UJP11017.1 hypothetical protein L2X99_05315 [Microbacterium sp. KUDC0406]